MAGPYVAGEQLYASARRSVRLQTATFPLTVSWQLCIEYTAEIIRKRQRRLLHSTAESCKHSTAFLHSPSVCQSALVRVIDVKKRFFTFLVTVLRFLTFFIFQTFLFKKTLAKFRAASRLTRSTFRITATK